MNATRRAAAMLPALLLAGCGGEGSAPVRAAVVDTIDGVETLTYAAAPATPLRWSLDTVAVLGDPFAEDGYQFDEVTPERLDGDDAGTLYLLDPQGGRILAYSPDGAHRATYGRSGEGPGELGQPMGIDLGPRDTVWVSDFSNSRLTGFPPDGGEPRVIPLPENAGIPAPRMAALEDGFLLLFRPLFGVRRAGGGSGGVQVSRPGGGDGGEPEMLPLLRTDRDLRPVDTLWTTPEPPMDMVQIEAANRIMVMMMSREFWPEFQWGAFSDGGVAISDTPEYLLSFTGPDGRVSRAVRRDPAPRPTTEADRELARQRAREASQGGVGVRVGSGGGPGEDALRRMTEQRIEKMTFADVIPRVVRLAVDPADRVWVGVSEDTPDEVERIDLYDRDGRLLGELRDFPFPDVFLGPDRIGVLRRDELDVQQVVMMRVDPGEG